MRKEQHQRSGI